MPFTAFLLWMALAPPGGSPALQLVGAARAQVGVTIRYDAQYLRIPYPRGDVPPERGVCTDVVVRAYRRLGIDLQVLVHEDMKAAREAYPFAWKPTAPDSNIDHRRVPNLAVFFRRHGRTLPLSSRGRDYLPGEIVTWDLGRGVPHIGIIADERGPDGVPLVIHNVGRGTRVEDRLFAYRMTGHFSYFP